MEREEEEDDAALGVEPAWFDAGASVEVASPIAAFFSSVLLSICLWSALASSLVSCLIGAG